MSREVILPNQMQQDHLGQIARGIHFATQAEKHGNGIVDPQYLQVVKGFVFGATRELQAEGFGVAAHAIIFQAKKVHQS